MCVCATDVGLVREHNEDACFVGENCCAVADGMGGHRAGEVASRMAIHAVEQELSRNGPAGFDIVRCIQQANAAVLDASRHADALEGMGTTLTVATLSPGALRVGHVGDSRAYLLTADGIKQLTDDHSVVGEMLRSGLITAEEAAAHPKRHAITRALGFFDDLEVDVGEWPVAREMLWCCVPTGFMTWSAQRRSGQRLGGRVIRPAHAMIWCRWLVRAVATITSP